MSLRRRAHDWIPPIAARALSGESRQALAFREIDGTWEDARLAAGGYDAPAILERVVASTRAVMRGEAAFERDGVTFPEPQVRWPILGALLRTAQRHHGRLRVLDFGGSLGSTYWQHRHLLEGLDLSWAVVEQSAFVTAGAEFTDGIVSFHPDVDAVCRRFVPNVVLLSSVLQYLPDPWRTLSELVSSGPDAIVIDRTTVSVGDGDRLAVEVVPASIYSGSYPAWILDRTRLLSAAPGWVLVDEFDGIEPDMHTDRGWPFRWRGYLLERPT